jgi:4-hydroxy-tetrahydrodipicolinate reductase
MNIALIGYGKMGREIEQIAIRRGHSVVLKVDEHNAKTFTDEELKKASVAIEFSTPDSVYDNTIRCFSAGVPVVAGTTGWTDKLSRIQEECIQYGGAFFYASNYSIGVNILFSINRYLARIMDKYPDYEPVLEETHHIYKKDSPSGTAITLADQIISELKRKTNWIEGLSNEPGMLQIHSKREGDVPGTHSVKYSSDIDDIEIIHTAHNRRGFALGAVLAAEWIAGKKGVFGMADLMGDL